MKYWVSFWVDDKLLPKFEMHRPWWVSAQDMRDRSSICCAVIADNEDAVKDYVKSCFDGGFVPKNIEYRFINKREEDWSPFSARFSFAEWMQWPGMETPEKVNTHWIDALHRTIPMYNAYARKHFGIDKAIDGDVFVMMAKDHFKDS